MITGKTTDTTGKIENDTGKITGKTIDVTGKINQDTGKINQDTGKIQFSDDFSGEVAGKIPETQEESPKYRGQRGQDKKPRNFPLHTLKNLPQFRDKSHEEIRRYILETRGVDIGGNFNWNGFAVAVLIVIAVMIVGYGLWKWHDHRKHPDNHAG